MVTRNGQRHGHVGTGFLLLNGLIIVISMLAIYLHFSNHQLLVQLSLEDGPVEWSTASIYLLAGTLFVVAAVKLPNHRLYLLFLGAMCLFVSGEEISWGQRVVGFNTPEIIGTNNTQSELNVHNLIGVHGIARFFGVLLVGMIFVILPISAYISDFCNRKLRQIGIVDSPLRYCHVAIIAILFQAVPRMMRGKPIWYFDEVGELLLSLAFLAFATTLAVRTIGWGASEARAGDWRGDQPLASPRA